MMVILHGSTHEGHGMLDLIDAQEWFRKTSLGYFEGLSPLSIKALIIKSVTIKF